MKIIIIGCGKVGSSLAELLVKEGHDVTVVDNNAAKLKKMQDKQDVMCIEGNGAKADVLREANVYKAGLLVAATPSDELNLLCCLLGKKLGAKKTISRVRNPEYYSQIDLIREDLGLSMVINPEFATASEILRVLIFPAAAKLEVFGKGRVELVEHKLSESSMLDGLSLAEIYKKLKIKFLICAVQRDSQIYIPGGDFILRAGDRIHIAASHPDIEKFFRASGPMKDKIKTVMIVGGGRVGYYLASQLTGVGMRVKIIDNNFERCSELAEKLPRATIIYGDGTDQELLQEEGISEVDSFIALTGLDEENIIISLYAKNNTNAKVITKISRDNYIGLSEQMGVDCIISPKYLSAGMILSYVRSTTNAAESNVESIYHIVGNKVEALEFSIKENIPSLVGIPLKDLKFKKNILVCAIIRGRGVIIPDGSSTVAVGDSVVVVAKEHRFSGIKDILD